MIIPRFIYKETKGQTRSVTVSCVLKKEENWRLLSTQYVSLIFRYIFWRSHFHHPRRRDFETHSHRDTHADTHMRTHPWGN